MICFTAAKYCFVVESEGGLELLEEVIKHPIPPNCVKELAAIVLENCKRFRERRSTYSDRQLDG